jgi:hypothetical protein
MFKVLVEFASNSADVQCFQDKLINATQFNFLTNLKLRDAIVSAYRSAKTPFVLNRRIVKNFRSLISSNEYNLSFEELAQLVLTLLALY